MMVINVDLLQWFINLLIKKLLVEQLKMKLYLIKNKQKNHTNQLLENLKKESRLTFYGQYLGRRSSTYVIDKQI